MRLFDKYQFFLRSLNCGPLFSWSLCRENSPEQPQRLGPTQKHNSSNQGHRNSKNLMIFSGLEALLHFYDQKKDFFYNINFEISKLFSRKSFNLCGSNLECKAEYIILFIFFEN